MGPFGVPELAIILVIVVIIFGVGKLPEIGGTFGKSIKEFKTQADDTADRPIMSIDVAADERAPSLTASPGASSHQDTGTRSDRHEVRANDV